MRICSAIAMGAALLLGFPAHAAETNINGIIISDPWACAEDAAVYMHITTRTTGGDTLTGAGTEISDRTEISTYVWEYGVLRLRTTETIEIAAGDTVTLKPGGNHLRLINLVGPLVADTAFDLELIFEKAGEGIVMVPVVKCEGQLNVERDVSSPPPPSGTPRPPATGYVPIPIPYYWPGSY